jgi:DNA-binding NarL/FixJ family response regulator
MIKVCFVEDSPVGFNALKLLLQESPLIEVAGMYATGEALISEYSFIRPDIVIMDLELPGISGIETIFTIKAEFPEAKFLVLTVKEDEEIVFKALKAGAGGYLLKKHSLENIVSEIVLFAQGGAPITPVIATKIIQFFTKDASYAVFSKLTDREKDILQLIVDGFLYKEIADQKSITIDGIKKHVSKIYEKLQVRTRSEAIKKYFTGSL